MRIFLCATYEDLTKEREAVLGAILRLQLEQDSMEYFGARPGQPIDTCLTEVRRSDVLVIVVSHLYGSIVPELGVSFSEAEYNEAYRLGKPCLIYFRAPTVPVLPTHVERDPEKLVLMGAFHERLMQRHTIASFVNTADLAVRAAADLGHLMMNFSNNQENKEDTVFSVGGAKLTTADAPPFVNMEDAHSSTRNSGSGMPSDESPSMVTLAELENIREQAIFAEMSGKVAHYIPELGMALDTKAGVSIHHPNGHHVSTRDSSRYNRSPNDGSIPVDQRSNDDSFTIQSVSKIFALLHVLETHGAVEVFQLVGKEPTGDPFNASPRIKNVGDARMPYNPLISAGAILITSLFEGKSGARDCNSTDPSKTNSAFGRFLEFVEKLCGVHNSVCEGKRLVVDEAVFNSERATGHNDRALAWAMDADGVFQNKLNLRGELKQSAIEKLGETRILEVMFVETVLNNYFRQCSILVTADHLAHAAAVLANGGVIPGTNDRVVHLENVTTAISLMSSCGMYDGSGGFAHNIGVPGISGIGGGIMCVAPGRMGIATFAPPLNSNGISARGIYALRELSRRYDFSIYQRPSAPALLSKYTTCESLEALVQHLKFDVALPGDLRNADYIPELRTMNALDTGVSISYRNEEGRFSKIVGGEVGTLFTLQSIGSLFALLYVLNTQSEEVVFSYVGKEPTGMPDDYFKWIEVGSGSNIRRAPFNPFITAGAIMIAAMVPSNYQSRTSAEGAVLGSKSVSLVNIDNFLEFVQKLCGNPKIGINWKVFQSEYRTGYRNRSLAWRMNDNQMFDDILRRRNVSLDDIAVEDILSVYLRFCSIEVTCGDLSRFAAVLANGGRDIETGENFIPRRYVSIVISLMSSAGLSTGSGDFASRVGVPTKSGVSGALVGVVPGKLGFAAYSPIVDQNGISYRAQKMLETIAADERWSIFGA